MGSYLSQYCQHEGVAKCKPLVADSHFPVQPSDEEQLHNKEEEANQSKYMRRIGIQLTRKRERSEPHLCQA